eukprot:jgi/Botrbrau1/12888/Bobra.0299s0008.1
MPETFEGGKSFLKLDEKLHPGDYLVSPDRKSKAVLQDDGNFVVYSHDVNGNLGVAFATHTYAGNTLGKEPAAWGIVQGDNNFVLYGKDDKAVWASNTVNKGLGQVVLQVGDDGILHLTDQAGGSRWNSGGSVWKQLAKQGQDAAVLTEYGSSVAYEKAKVGASVVAEKAKEGAAVAYEAGSAAAKVAGEKLSEAASVAQAKATEGVDFVKAKLDHK